jgi:hypothetical protein
MIHATHPLLPQQQLTEFCQRHHIRKLSLFGSVLRDDFTEASDIDFLVEFEPNHIPGYFRLTAMEIELSELIGRKADLRTPNELSHYFRQQVLQESVVQYVKN